MAKLITIEQPLERESAVALGFFDGVHLGHRAVLRAAADCAAEKGLLSGAFTFAADSVPVKQGRTLSYLYTDRQKMQELEACGIERAALKPPQAAPSHWWKRAISLNWTWRPAAWRSPV